MTALRCQKAFWLQRFRPELRQEAAQQFHAEAGTKVGELATKLYPDGILIERNYWEVAEAESDTRESALERVAIFEATAINPATGGFSRADIMAPKGGLAWDLVEVKSSTRVKAHQIVDLAFQYHVFNAAGYEIDRCYILHLNRDYMRQGDLSLSELFRYHDATDKVLELQASTIEAIDELSNLLEMTEPPTVNIGGKCKSPHECEFISHCWNEVPDYSVFNALREPKATKLVAEFGPELETLPQEYWPGGSKALEIKSFRSNEIAVDRRALSGFAKRLNYPLCFLDFETVMPAVPVFDQSRPYEQIPFQFSAHQQAAPNERLSHHEYIHMERSDPRRRFAEALVETCGSEGSIVVYNQSFEASRIKELAALFPDLANRLLSLNTRMVDLLVPFKNRWLYHPKQNGSASIKAVLPAFTDLSYEGMNIANGGEAMEEFLKFLENDLDNTATENLRNGLSEYCALDTFAMVELLRVVESYVN